MFQKLEHLIYRFLCWLFRLPSPWLVERRKRYKKKMDMIIKSAIKEFNVWPNF